MQVFVGVDLGSTTTKAVVLTGQDEILGRGITNSRSNYDVACSLARHEAFTTARFSLMRRELPGAAEVAPVLERQFRLVQHMRQLSTLREACVTQVRGDDELPALSEIFAGMTEMAAALFATDAAMSARSDFFRDIAASQYLRQAETITRRGRVKFDRLMSLFDKSILLVENAPPDLSFEGNIREAAEAAIASGLLPAGTDAGGVMHAVERVLATALDEASAVGTGYGRARLPFPKERIRSEILCHGLGAHYFFPATATVLDIGGQDTKAIQIDPEGIVTSFQMNDRCAAGCGRYLGYIADEMNLGLHELGPLAQTSCRPAKIASTCTVFAGAELRERLSLGEKREDILAGLHRAIILRAMSLLARSGGIRDQFTFTGGVAKNPAALAALRKLVQENYGERTMNVSPDSIYTGAVGAALFARRAWFETDQAAA